MIHYHGLPITPNTAALQAVSAGHAFVSFAHPDQLGIAIDVCQSFGVDNGAFSAWKSGKLVTDWSKYYAWVDDCRRYPGFDFAVIPDVIEGDEADNDALVREWPFTARHANIGAPVWHMHESIERLERLAQAWARVCIGSSGQYATIGTSLWWGRMTEALNAITDSLGRPWCQLHGLRMLDPQIFRHLPLKSADSTNIGRNIGIDKAWRGTYTPLSKDCRARVMRERIEAFNSAPHWDACEYQTSITFL